MPRVSHVVASLKRKKRIFKKTKGFWGGRSRLYRSAIETLRRSMAFAYRDRRDRKAQFRRLWIARINAACRENNIIYSRFIDGLKKAQVAVDRKILAELAVSDKQAFSELVKVAKAAEKPKVKTGNAKTKTKPDNSI
jgi:large subunit ribosomal protein L20